MKKSLIVGLCVGGLLATAGGAIALRDNQPAQATILAVTPITAAMEQQYAEVTGVTAYQDPSAPRVAEVISTRAISVPGGEQEVCEDVLVTESAPVRDKHQIAGTAAGAVIGGALGNQVGGGNGKKLATAAGAIIGGVVGRNVQAQQQGKQVRETYERQCRLERGADRVAGYDVTYRLDGASHTARLDYEPSDKLPLVNNRPVTSSSEARRLMEQRAPQQFSVSYTLQGRGGNVVLPTAPAVGELLLADQGEVITDPAKLAAVQARQHQVVAYKVDYQWGREKGEVRMQEKPNGTHLPVANGQIVAGGSGQL